MATMDYTILIHEQRDGYCYCVIELKNKPICRIARRGDTLEQALEACLQGA